MLQPLLSTNRNSFLFIYKKYNWFISCRLRFLLVFNSTAFVKCYAFYVTVLLMAFSFSPLVSRAYIYNWPHVTDLKSYVNEFYRNIANITVKLVANGDSYVCIRLTSLVVSKRYIPFIFLLIILTFLKLCSKLLFCVQ